MSELEYESPHHKMEEEKPQRTFVQQVDWMTLDQIYKKEIELRMEFFQNNKTKVAESLGITQKTLYNKLHQYGWMESGKCRKF